MATKAKKSSSAKGSKTAKSAKAAKASSVKKTGNVKAKKSKGSSVQSKGKKSSATKAGSKKTAAKSAHKSTGKVKAGKPGKAKIASKGKSIKKAAPAKAVKAKSPKKPAAKPTSVATVKANAISKTASSIPAANKSAVSKPATPKAKAEKSKSSSTKKPMVAAFSMTMESEILPYQEETGEDYMNKKQQDHFRVILLQRKKEFMDEMEKTVHHLQDEAANFPDPNDRATQEEEFGLVLRTRDRELKYIKNIEDALQRIDEGEYGYCEACGVEIGVRRLEARPTATLCIDCKTLDEIREKQMGG